ncbi:heat shock protein beta-7-like [Lampris incognitus]|uniref:heat shock protein beta-7-like n=1 Tax=Lampris incognitus TaxID=2546036 RepID=UPI0024B5A377|nr:heat shock protein beta-7-like [Lampris incognitus]
MASLTSCSCRSSSMSYRLSSRYSTSRSYRSDESTERSSDSPDPLFEPLPDTADPYSLFGGDSPGAPLCLAPFRRHSRSSYGHTGPAGGAVTDRQTSTGAVRSLGDSYYVSADVGQFEPHDVVVMAFNHQIVIHAEKVREDGSVSDTFTHKSLLPEDMDPLTVRGSLSPDGILVVGVQRTRSPAGSELPGPSNYTDGAHL